MEIRSSLGRLLFISIFLFIGFNLLSTPINYTTKLDKAVTSLKPFLQTNLGFELPVETIMLNSKVILQGIGALSVIGGVAAALKQKVGILMLLMLTLVGVVAAVVDTSPIQKGEYLLKLLKTVGVLGGVILLYTHGRAEADQDKDKQD
jgi:hypothetical protein